METNVIKLRSDEFCKSIIRMTLNSLMLEWRVWPANTISFGGNDTIIVRDDSIFYTLKRQIEFIESVFDEYDFPCFGLLEIQDDTNLYDNLCIFPVFNLISSNGILGETNRKYIKDYYQKLFDFLKAKDNLANYNY